MDNSLPPGFVKFLLPAARIRQRLQPLRFCFCGNQVGQALRLSEVNLAHHEGAAGEFPGLRHSQAANSSKRSQTGGHGCHAAVQVQLGAVLAGETVRRREKQCQTLIQHCAVRRSNETEFCAARFRQSAQHGRKTWPHMRAGKPDDCYAGGQAPGRQREYCVGEHRRSRLPAEENIRQIASIVSMLTEFSELIQ